MACRSASRRYKRRRRRLLNQLAEREDEDYQADGNDHMLPVEEEYGMDVQTDESRDSADNPPPLQDQPSASQDASDSAIPLDDAPNEVAQQGNLGVMDSASQADEEVNVESQSGEHQAADAGGDQGEAPQQHELHDQDRVEVARGEEPGVRTHVIDQGPVVQRRELHDHGRAQQQHMAQRGLVAPDHASQVDQESAAGNDQMQASQQCRQHDPDRAASSRDGEAGTLDHGSDQGLAEQLHDLNHQEGVRQENKDREAETSDDSDCLVLMAWDTGVPPWWRTWTARDRWLKRGNDEGWHRRRQREWKKDHWRGSSPQRSKGKGTSKVGKPRRAAPKARPYSIWSEEEDEHEVVEVEDDAEPSSSHRGPRPDAEPFTVENAMHLWREFLDMEEDGQLSYPG